MEQQKYDMSKFKTGDILLFGSKRSYLSRLIEWWCDSKWSHVGIILKAPVHISKNLTGYYLLESGYENFVDAEDHIQKYGVQIVPLDKVLNSYDGYIYWRKLDIKVKDLDKIEDVNMADLQNVIDYKLAMIYKEIKNKPYDVSLYDFLSLKMNIDFPEIRYSNPLLNWLDLFDNSHRKLDSFICSGLVAFVYTELNFLDKNTEWSECMPKYFSSENKNLVLNNCSLEPEYKIK